MGPDGFRYYWHDFHKKHRRIFKRKHSGGCVTVIGAISFNGHTSLAFIIDRENSENCQEILVDHLLPFSEIVGEKKRIFEHTNALIYTSNKTSMWLISNKVSVLKWHVISSDLNLKT